MKTHLKCDDCGSSDALTLYDDGHTHCFSCGSTRHPERQPRGNRMKIQALPERKITEKTAEFFEVESDEFSHSYPYYNKDGVEVARKIRNKDPKGFKWVGNAKQAGLFGMNKFPKGSAKQITIVEGECDAMAVREMMGVYPVVSVQSAGQATKNVADNFEYLNSFGTIVVCFDTDEPKVNPQTGKIHYPGQEAAIAVANSFEPGKVRILTLAEYKDANEYLINGKAKSFNDEWWKAPQFMPSGLKFGKDMWEDLTTPREYETVSYPFTGFNEKTYGIRLSELIVFTADTGVGKTSVLKEIEHHLIKEARYGLGVMHLEETNYDTVLGIMSVNCNKSLHLPDVRETVSTEDFKGAFEAVTKDDKLVLYDHFGSNDIHEILAKVRHMHNLGCKYIVIDHLSIIVSDQSGDERKQLDEITTKLKTLTMELNISVIAVVHINRQGQIRGTGGIAQLANMVFRLERDVKSPDDWRRNITKVTLEKNRFCGRTGPVSYLEYINDTGRLVELEHEDILKFEGTSHNFHPA